MPEKYFSIADRKASAPTASDDFAPVSAVSPRRQNRAGLNLNCLKARHCSVGS